MDCAICQLPLKDGEQFVVAPNAEGLLKNPAHVACSVQNDAYAGLDAKILNSARLKVLEAHASK